MPGLLALALGFRQRIHQPGQGLRNVGGWQSADEQRRVADFVARPPRQEAVQLRLQGQLPQGRLALQEPEGTELAFSRDDVQDDAGTECPDQLIFQVRPADARMHTVWRQDYFTASVRTSE